MWIEGGVDQHNKIMSSFVTNNNIIEKFGLPVFRKKPPTGKQLEDDRIKYVDNPIGYKKLTDESKQWTEWIDSFARQRRSIHFKHYKTMNYCRFSRTQLLHGKS